MALFKRKKKTTAKSSSAKSSTKRKSTTKKKTTPKKKQNGQADAKAVLAKLKAKEGTGTDDCVFC